MIFALEGRMRVLEVPRPDGLALLEWLELGRPEFGAVAVDELIPRCRRRLWPERRNDGPLRHLVGQLLDGAAGYRDGTVHFG
jgi:hypothetical protein